MATGSETHAGGTHVIESAALARFSSGLFRACGVAPVMADEWARSLVWANLRGTDSHGVLRIPGYIDRLKAKAINPAPAITVTKRSGAVAVIDADRAPGAVAMSMAMAEAVARAREVHVGWCAARNITHAGAVGYFALQAAQAGMAGIVMSASGPMMAYHGSRAAGVSTNPIAIAFPAKRRRPFVLDMSTSTVAMGKVMNARDAGQSIPSGWGLDRDGHATTDPRRVATLVPLGGPKGSGLSLMIECLCSLAIGNPIIAPALSGGLDAPSMNGLAMAVDLAALGDLAGTLADADRLGDAISALPPDDDAAGVLLPGERGDRTLAQRERDGIPLPQGTWSRLRACARDLAVTPP